MAKLRWPKKSFSRATKSLLTHSQSWDSGVGSSVVSDETEDDGFADEEDLPDPPLVPTVEYLLGKRPVNLRKRASDSLKQEIKLRAATLATNEGEGEGGDVDDVYDSDGHSSVGSSQGDKKHRRKKEKQKKKKRRGSKDDDDMVEWNYNKLTVPQSSPPRERKSLLGVERHPTPIPQQQPPLNGLPFPQRLDFSSAFDEVTKELEQAALWDSSPPSSLSPLNSPSPKSPISPTSQSPLHASPLHTATPTTTADRVHRPAPPPPSTNTGAPQKSNQPKRSAPKLPPHLQNKKVLENTNKNNNEKSTTGQTNKKASPISKILSSRNKSSQQKSQGKVPPPNQKSPSEFMAALTEAVSSSPKLPRFMRQEGTSDTSPVSPTMDEIELQINEMQRTLLSSTTAPNRPPSPEPAQAESDSESSEYTSSSDDTSTSESDDSSSGDSSDEDLAPKKPPGPRRPIMARNIGMSAGSRRRNGVFNRARLLARYPRLLRKKFMKLEPIYEVPEEMIYAAVSLSLCLE